MSLENHLAFAAVKAGAGGHAQMTCLLRVVYLAWYLRDTCLPRADIELFRQGEQALEHCIERSLASGEWSLQVGEQEIVGQILSLHDAQLSAAPAHQYFRAWAQLQAFLKSGQASVLDG
ncbi:MULTISPECIES: hypothetical protein [Burkholderia]|uniref:Fis family transcriptional regulator n=1 Tax=Burkholderia paludis TaxID=1506587 RepID=A0A6J5F551_9BURK|nr:MULTISPECIES: hypothetical protein [Burkholderia]CAB3773919.1 hypothetical protein LMG30113_07363 [Burkholderia paludis]VWC47381.1 Fis family transcriptional regulator [Burkholderia paludis]